MGELKKDKFDALLEAQMKFHGITPCSECTAKDKRIAELKAKLDRVRGLPEKWRDISYKTTDAYTNLHGCADELQSALGDEDAETN